MEANEVLLALQVCNDALPVIALSLPELVKASKPFFSLCEVNSNHPGLVSVEPREVTLALQECSDTQPVTELTQFL